MARPGSRYPIATNRVLDSLGLSQWLQARDPYGRRMLQAVREDDICAAAQRFDEKL